MKLDNRPKKLHCQGDTGRCYSSLARMSLGHIDSVDSVGEDEVLVGFRTRAAAEQALAKGNDIPSIGMVRYLGTRRNNHLQVLTPPLFHRLLDTTPRRTSQKMCTLLYPNKIIHQRVARKKRLLRVGGVTAGMKTTWASDDR
ncbi:hypothetical protein JVT61DRAFT_9342 [Boletus reticuloceps]|uniref:Uncharacterized protein n=1 Tax=Boletus reticuloceps TaxID=495285 RepID=A0A8I3A624_9AGAM|nr:hypothetical protein JVT61DRAFT_9342 [Boletus reticuloceps]